MAQAPTPPAALPRMQTIEERDRALLHKILMDEEARPNILTLSEFRRYAPLFTPQTGDENSQTVDPNRANLAREFQSRILLKRPTHVVSDTNPDEVLLRLPRLITGLSTLAPTPENDQAVLTNYNHRLSDLPIVWSTATNAMARKVLEQQGTPEQVKVFQEARKETIEILNEFDRKRGREPQLPEATPNTTETLSADDFEEL